MSKQAIDHNYSGSEIAIIGMTCRLPGAKNVDEFWKNLCNGVESISFFSDEELILSGVDPSMLLNTHYVRASGVLSDIDLFDATFFGINAREAEVMDPQHRLFLEAAWEALESVGYDANRFKGSIGVYAGVSSNSYLFNNLYPNRSQLQSFGEFQLMIGNDKDFLTTRVSHKLNLTGPSLNVQTACSTSLVSIHLACQSLLGGECDMALAGGASIRVPQKEGYLYQKDMILSPDGHCKAFDTDALGTVGGSGVGIVVLKRLKDAINDGDQIQGVIKGSAVNNDGSLKVGFTAPSIDGQVAVISEAQAVAGVSPDTVTFVECHGTGTTLGDPIEIAALTQAFRLHTQAKQFCAVSSVKTNIGHLDVVAGVASVIKTVLSLKHKTLVPNLHYKTANHEIDFENSPFYVSKTTSRWASNGSLRRAGVSSFGIGGTNAHVVVEEAPLQQPSGPSRPWQILTLSAKTAPALKSLSSNLAAFLVEHPETNIADTSYTLQIGRKVFGYKRVVICQDTSDAAKLLKEHKPPQNLMKGGEDRGRRITFMFPGQGTQYVNMAHLLYNSELSFRKVVDQCADILLPHLSYDLRQILYPNKLAEGTLPYLQQTSFAQPALFVIEYALASLWMEWGAQPQAMIGHSIGEYVAACLAGVFALEDALRLVALRGKLMQQVQGGAMLAVSLPEYKVKVLLNGKLSLAAINHSSLCTISGTIEDIEQLQKYLTINGIHWSRLYTSHAFHSKMMDPVVEPFVDVIRQINLLPPKIPFISNVTGEWIKTNEATDPQYWGRHLRNTVQFSEGAKNLLEVTNQIIIEVGPGQTLSALVKSQMHNLPKDNVLGSLPGAQNSLPEDKFLATELGKFWLLGGNADWEKFRAHEQRHRVSLPTYPFERKSYWIKKPERPEQSSFESNKNSKLKGKNLDITNWMYVPSWRQSLPTKFKQLDSASYEGKYWLIFVDDLGLGNQLEEELRKAGLHAVTVRKGEDFVKHSGTSFTINPSKREDYEALVNELKIDGQTPSFVAHCWNVSAKTSDNISLQDLDDDFDSGFFSLIFFVQALSHHNLVKHLKIAIFTKDVQGVTGNSIKCPQQALALGAIKVIPQEYKNVACCAIDICFSGVEKWDDERLCKQFISDVISTADNASIAYSGGCRWVQDFEPAPLQNNEVDSKLKPHGVYLITGGLGAIGSTLGAYLAEAVKAKLVIVTRSIIPDRALWEEWIKSHDAQNPTSQKINRIVSLEDKGAEVLLLNADVTNIKQMEYVVEKAVKRFKQIDGVIHAAGIPGGGLVQLKTPDAAKSVLFPKVKGTVVLNNVLKGQKLDFLMLCSSLSSILGGFGQIDYCAANAFLDTFSRYKRLQGSMHTVSINWDAWQQIGMAAGAPQLEINVKRVRKHYEEKGVIHPLIHQRIKADKTNVSYVTKLRRSDSWVLNEHKLGSVSILPGTAYLEMARAALEDWLTGSKVDMHDINFVTPLMIDNDDVQEVYTNLTKREDFVEFSVLTESSRKSSWREHAKGKLRFGKVQEIKHDNIYHLISSLSKTLDVQDVRLEVGKINFGPRWENIDWLKYDGQYGLARISLPKEFIPDLDTYKLHPALLDTATGFFPLNNSSGYVPQSYKKLTMFRPLVKDMYSYIKLTTELNQQGGGVTFNIVITDYLGNVLVAIEEYSMRKIHE